METRLIVGEEKFSKMIKFIDCHSGYDFDSMFYKGEIYPYKSLTIPFGEKRFLRIKFLCIPEEWNLEPKRESIIIAQNCEIRDLSDKKEEERFRSDRKSISSNCSYLITKDGVETYSDDRYQNDLSDVKNSYYEFLQMVMVNR